jgi:hypothetical protein
VLASPGSDILLLHQLPNRAFSSGQPHCIMSTRQNIETIVTARKARA